MMQEDSLIFVSLPENFQDSEHQKGWEVIERSHLWQE